MDEGAGGLDTDRIRLVNTGAAGRPPSSGGVVYWTPGNDTFAAINVTTGAIKWTAPMTQAYTLNGVTLNGAARPNPRSLRPDRGLVLRAATR